MNKTKYLILAFCVLILNSTMAQKVSKKPMGFNFYIEPLVEFPTDLKKYTSTINSPLSVSTDWEETGWYTSSDSYSVKQEKIERAKKLKRERLAKKHLKIDLSRLAPSKIEGDFSITLETSGVDVSYVNVTNVWELNPEEIVTRYSYSAKVQIKDNTENVIFEKFVHRDEAGQLLTKKDLMFNVTLKAKLDLNKNKPEKQAKIIQKYLDNRELDILMEALRNANGAINNEYGRRYVMGSYAFFGVKGKSFSELEDTKNDLVKSLTLFKKKKISKEEYGTKLSEATVIWEKALEEQAGELDPKAVSGLNLNCAFAYTWNGEYEKAKTYLDKVPEAFQFEEIDPNNAPPPTPAGAILPFADYAVNIREFYEIYSSVDMNRITFR